MAIFFSKKNKTKNIYTDKEIRDSLLQILKDIDSKKYIEKALSSVKSYNDNKSFILKNNKDFWSKNYIYPSHLIYKLIKILNDIPDGDISIISEKIDSDKELGDSNTFITYSKNRVSICIAAVDKYQKKYESGPNDMYNKYHELYWDIVEALEEVVKTINLPNKTFDIKLYKYGDHSQIRITCNNAK